MASRRPRLPIGLVRRSSRHCASVLYAAWHGAMEAITSARGDVSTEIIRLSFSSASNPFFHQRAMARGILEGALQKLRLQYLLWRSLPHAFVMTQQPHRGKCSLDESQIVHGSKDRDALAAQGTD